ncbi:MAG: type II secretion system protein [bacterium]|nr:type II secretion system protein [bacterium]
MREHSTNGVRRPARTASARRRSGGFTLVELLVVVSIIALLVAILLPSLKRAREQAKLTKCMAHLHSIGLALVTYSDENRQFYPSYWTIGAHSFRVRPNVQTSPGSPPEVWGLQSVLHYGQQPAVNPYTGYAYPLKSDKPVYLPYDSPAWVCPSNPGPRDMEEEWKSWGNTYAYFCNSANNYNADEWATKVSKKSGRYLVTILWDNIKKLPGESGFLGPFGEGYSVRDEDKQAPHQVKGNQKGVTKYKSVLYSDMHVELMGLEQDDLPG